MKLVDIFTQVINQKYNHTSPNQGSYAYKKEKDKLYLYFEESNGKIDWKNNFSFPAESYRDMGVKWKAHKGFVRVWKEIEPFLEKVIMDKSIKEVVIAGYSHGGAIAALAHEYVWFNRPDLRNNIDTYAFEAPRVFWGWTIPKELKQRWTNFKVYRNGQDLVTYMPPALLGYKHIGEVIQINKNRIIIDDTYYLKCINEHNYPNVIAALAEMDKK